MQSKKKVAIFGGGIAGLTAAHELINTTEFDVTVYEKRNLLGGKARSFDRIIEKNGIKVSVPAEHGFRFFPSFYKHLDGIMKDVEYNGKDVTKHFRPMDVVRVFLMKAPCFDLPLRLHNFDYIFASKKTRSAVVEEYGITDSHQKYFINRVIQILLSSEERFKEEFDNLDWWEYLEAESSGKGFQDVLARGLSRGLVAANPRTMNTRTGAQILEQLFYDILYRNSADRVLDGPTSSVWIDPWIEYLRSKGVRFITGSEVVGFISSVGGDDTNAGQGADRISLKSVVCANGLGDFKVDADHFLMALPLEKMYCLLGGSHQDARDQMDQRDRDSFVDDLLTEDPALANIITLYEGIKARYSNKEKDLSVDWMVGMQIYSKQKLDFCKGHIIIADSPWAITLLHQNQFWEDRFNNEIKANSGIESIVSLIICDWNTPVCAEAKKPCRHFDQECQGKGCIKPAKNCDKPTLYKEVLRQINICIHQSEDEMKMTPIDEDQVMGFVLDGLLWDDAKDEWQNDEPLFINLRGLTNLRPTARTRISNMFLAGDYIRTNTNLATMESACESGKRAVNAILDREDYKGNYCKVHKLERSPIFRRVRRRDRERHDRGLPYQRPGILSLLWGISKNPINYITSVPAAIGIFRIAPSGKFRWLAGLGLGLLIIYILILITVIVIALAWLIFNYCPACTIHELACKILAFFRIISGC